MDDQRRELLDTVEGVAFDSDWTFPDWKEGALRAVAVDALGEAGLWLVAALRADHEACDESLAGYERLTFERALTEQIHNACPAQIRAYHREAADREAEADWRLCGSEVAS